MERTKLIESLSTKKYNKGKFYGNKLLIVILYIITVGSGIYFGYFKNKVFSLTNAILFLSLFSFVVFFHKLIIQGFHIKKLYLFLSLLGYFIWIAYHVIMSAENWSNAFVGWECAVEIIGIGVCLGILLFSVIKKAWIQSQDVVYWLPFVVSVAFGFYWIDSLCGIAGTAHDLIWHGLFPFFLSFWFFWKKL